MTMHGTARGPARGAVAIAAVMLLAGAAPVVAGAGPEPAGTTAAGAMAAGTTAAGTTAAGTAAHSPAQALAWLGCWQPRGSVGDAALAHMICVTPVDGGLELTTYAEGAIVAREVLAIDGSRRTVEDRGCAGWESAEWSADGRRVYMRSELACDGGNVRRATGMLAMKTPSEWLDIQVITTGAAAGERGVRVVSYVEVGAERAAQLGATAPADRSLAVATARQAAAAPVSFAALHDALGNVDVEAVEAWLIERESRFALNARRLIELADAGVPESVIDLLVALSNPSVFAIDHAARSGEFRPAERATRADDMGFGSGRYGSDYRQRSWFDWDPYYGYGYGISPYSRYGFGSGYGRYYGGYTPIIVIVRPGESTDDGAHEIVRRRVVRDRGFVTGDRGAGSGTANQPAARGTRGTSGGSSTGAQSGSSNDESSTGRRATRRGGNEQEQ